MGSMSRRECVASGEKTLSNIIRKVTELHFCIEHALHTRHVGAAGDRFATWHIMVALSTKLTAHSRALLLITGCRKEM